MKLAGRTEDFEEETQDRQEKPKLSKYKVFLIEVGFCLIILPVLGFLWLVFSVLGSLNERRATKLVRSF